MTDPIADMLSRVRNAIAVNKTQVTLPYSDAKERVARVLVQNGFLQGTKTGQANGRKVLTVIINDENSSTHITKISRLSRPGRRRYVKADDMPKVKRGRGLIVVSTSRGVMTGEEARAKKLGGELICEVY